VGMHPVDRARPHRLTLLRDHDPDHRPADHRAAAPRARAADHVVDDGEAAAAAARGPAAPNASPDQRATAP
jgi:hypothetical protein